MPAPWIMHLRCGWTGAEVTFTTCPDTFVQLANSRRCVFGSAEIAVLAQAIAHGRFSVARWRSWVCQKRNTPDVVLSRQLALSGEPLPFVDLLLVALFAACDLHLESLVIPLSVSDWWSID